MRPVSPPRPNNFSEAKVVETPVATCPKWGITLLCHLAPQAQCPRRVPSPWSVAAELLAVLGELRKTTKQIIPAKHPNRKGLT